MKTGELILVIIVVVLLLSGLILLRASMPKAEPVREEAGLQPVPLGQVGGGGVTVDVLRFVDEEAGVVCWVAKASNKAGLSCLPLGVTLLDSGR